MICFPNAKINLGLNIVSRRSDGYHNIETLFYPVELRDALEITLLEEKHKSFFSHTHTTSSNTKNENVRFRLFQQGTPIEGKTEDNLVIKALQLIAAENSIPAIDIHLIKKIPSGAGLGGGSSDAAFMLKMLNNTFKLNYSDDKLTALAASIGADCPFFIHNKPSLATGIGDKLQAIDINLSQYFFIIVKPEIAISSKEAYSLIIPKTPDIPLKKVVKEPVNEWKRLMKNDFELSIFKKYPEICRIKEQFYEMGAIYASMSGSGSSVYAFFEKEIQWEGLFSNHFVWTSSPKQQYNIS